MIPYSTEFALFAAGGLFAFFSLGMQPIENSLFAQFTPERWRSTAYGLKFTMTFGIGASAVAMVEWVAPANGFIGVYHVLAFVVAGIIAAVLALIWIQRAGQAQRVAPVTAAGGE